MALRLASRQARLVVFGYNAATMRIGWIRNPVLPQYAGSPLSLRGGQVMAYYKDGTISDVTGSCSYDPAEGSLLEYGGELNIAAYYTDHAGNQFTADTKIEISDVEELVFSSISNPVQKDLRIIDLEGLTIAQIETYMIYQLCGSEFGDLNTISDNEFNYLVTSDYQLILYRSEVQ